MCQSMRASVLLLDGLHTLALPLVAVCGAFRLSLNIWSKNEIRGIAKEWKRLTSIWQLAILQLPILTTLSLYMIPQGAGLTFAYISFSAYWPVAF